MNAPKAGNLRHERGSTNKIRCPWRFNEDGELIIKHPTWMDYFRHNYTTKYGVKVECDQCHRSVVASKLARHHTSKICKKQHSQQTMLLSQHAPLSRYEHINLF